MATYSRSIRRGLPRVAGAEPWPAGGDAPDTAEAPDAADAENRRAEPADRAEPAEPADRVSMGGPVTLRQGLPRTPNGDPWPPVTSVAVADPAPSREMPTRAPQSPTGAARTEATPVTKATHAGTSPAAVSARDEESSIPAGDAAPVAVSRDQPPAASGEVRLRRGLARVAGGDGWPPAGSVAPLAAVAVSPEPAAVQTDAPDAPDAPDTADVADALDALDALDARDGTRSPASATARPPASVPAPASEVAIAGAAVRRDVSQPLAFRQTVFPGQYANVPLAVVDKRRYGKFTFWQWAGILVGAGGALLGAAAMAVITVRLLLSFDGMRDFMATYPGTYDLPDSAQPGFPVWVQWQHFFNMFLILLIIRSGWRVRTERRPDAFWTPRRSQNGRGKISLTLWWHQALDLLWVTNGIVFVVMLFVSGHWMRIIPTSWEVFPNALSAILQYISLDWPVEHGWVNYNSIQQLMYFTIVFIAAPVAIVTGVRMSNLWPKKATALNKAYPVEIARALHLPTMLFFVVFIIIHVILVLATGALRNLNHMFGGTDELNWTGFWLFFASLCVLVGAWFAARPIVIAPIAKLFGKVSAR